MSKSNASGIDGLRCDYRLGLSSASTKAALKQSMMNIRMNQSRAQAIERSHSHSRMAFYKDISKKTLAFNEEKTSEKKAKRPMSQYLSLRPFTASKKGNLEAEMQSATEAVVDDEISLRPRNHNLAHHYQRTLSGAAFNSVNRAQSAFNIRKLESAKTLNMQRAAKDSKAVSHKQFRTRDIQSAVARNQVIIEEEQVHQQDGGLDQVEEGSRSPKVSSSKQEFSEEENSQDREKRELLDYFNSNPKKCMDLVMYKLDKCQEALGMADEDIKKRREQLQNEQLTMLTGKTDGVHPWEHVSLYMEGEPSFNNPNYRGNYKREPLLQIEARDEDEIALLMEGAYERFDFCKKHTTMKYDQDFNFLKTTQNRLTYTEVTKIKQQFASKREGYSSQLTQRYIRLELYRVYS